MKQELFGISYNLEKEQSTNGLMEDLRMMAGHRLLSIFYHEELIQLLD